MTTVTMPRLAGSRGLVASLLDELPADLTGCSVTIDAEPLASAAPSFADQLCKEILATRNANRLDVLAASPRFEAYLVRSADIRGLADRLFVTPR
ncbi:hypothetical protein A3L23_02089 [Rhodococcoides fascians D188]|nr:hypothetical protein A3L23_02089 [Rhodococcus fascians D188]